MTEADRGGVGVTHTGCRGEGDVGRQGRGDSHCTSRVTEADRGGVTHTVHRG